MTLYTHAGELPRHFYISIEPGALGDHERIAAVWFGLVSYPGRVWGCHLMLECGAVYRNVPLHQLTHGELWEREWGPAQAQTWNCYGWQFSTIEYRYLAGLRTRVRLQDGREYGGTYLFTVVPVGDAYSAAPEQSKEVSFIALDNGRFSAQPTDRVLFEDRSFTSRDAEWPTWLRRQRKTWSAET